MLGNILIGNVWYFRQPDWFRDTMELELGHTAAFDLFHNDDALWEWWF